MFKVVMYFYDNSDSKILKSCSIFVNIILSIGFSQNNNELSRSHAQYKIVITPLWLYFAKRQVI